MSLVRLAAYVSSAGVLKQSIKQFFALMLLFTHVSAEEPQRIISLAPTVTEMLFAVGAGERVVGVTQFCHYPPEATSLPRVGGVIEPHYEVLLALRPDLVVTVTEQSGVRARLRRLGISTLTVEGGTIGDLFAALVKLGETLGSSAQAAALRDELKRCVEEVARQTETLDKPKVLVSIGGPGQELRFKSLSIAGPGTFYDELIRLAGGKNAYRGPDIPYPSISPEGLAALKPDIIIELLPGGGNVGTRLNSAIRRWQSLVDGPLQIPAVTQEQVHVYAEDYLLTPGPRLNRIIQRFVEAVHPETGGSQAIKSACGGN